MNKKETKTILGLSVGRFILVLTTAVILAVTTLMFPPENPWENFQVLPLFISLCVMIIQSSANRYGYLLGSLNSLIYAAVYLFILGLPGSASSAAFISFPFQLATFISWSRKPYGNSTVFKKFSKLTLVITSVALCAIWAIWCLLTSSFASLKSALDIATALLGYFIPILTMLGFLDYIYFNLVSQAIGIVLMLTLTITDISRLPNLVYSVYAGICLILAFRKITALYKEQNSSKGE